MTDRKDITKEPITAAQLRDAYDDCSGAEPSLSVLHIAVERAVNMLERHERAAVLTENLTAESEAWLNAWFAVASTVNGSAEACTRFADICRAEYRKRFLVNAPPQPVL